MTRNIKLFHPIYLDFSMMISFVAAMEGGYALEKSIKQKDDDASGSTGQVSAELGSSGLLANLIKSNIKASANVEDKQGTTVESQILYKHTASSVFMGLRENLHNQQRIISLDECEKEQWDNLQLTPPTELVEISGYIHRSPISEIAELGERILPFIQQSNPNSNQQSIPPEAGIIKSTYSDLKRSPIYDVLLNHEEGKLPKKAVIDLSAELLPLEKQDRLLCGRVAVLGKATRVLKNGETISLFRRSILGYGDKAMKENMLSMIPKLTNTSMGLSPHEIAHPAIEIIPMAIYV